MKLSKTRDGIIYLYDYYPTRFKEYHSGISEKIIHFKDGNIDAIDYFCRILKEVLDETFKENIHGLSEYMVCIMPSHFEGMYSVGLRLLAHFLVDIYGMTDGIELVQRIETHDRNANGGDRSLEGQIKTLRIDDRYVVEDKKILLLDDVTTTGNSIFAVKKLLEDRGNNWFVPLVLGRTTYPIGLTYISEDLPEDRESLSDEGPAPNETNDSEFILGNFEIAKLSNIEIQNWDYDDIKQRLEKALTLYKNLAYTTSNIKDAKKDKADLNKAKRIIEDARKAYKKQCLEPYNALEPRIMELTNMIEVQRIAIDEVVKDYEIQRIERKEKEIRAYYDKMSAPLGEYADALYGMLRNPKWFNASTDKQKYEEGIRNAISEIADDIKIIKELNSPFYHTVMEKYTNTLSIQQALAKNTELILATEKAGLSDAMVVAESIENVVDNVQEEKKKRRVRIYADDEQMNLIFKYIESVGAKYIVEG